MRDEDGRATPWGWATAIAMVAGLTIAGVAGAQTLRGVAELEYQNQESSTLFRRETWGKAVALDYSTRFRQELEFSSRLRFSEQTVVGGSYRVRTPEASVRLSHRNFGLSSSYQPSEIRDEVGFLARQQTLSLTGYAQKPGLPSVTGSWIRNHLDANSRSPASATVSREIGSTYGTKLALFRAGYGDRFNESIADPRPRMTENHLSLGASSQFTVGRAPVSVYYGFGQSHTNPTGAESIRSRSHQVGGTSSLALSPRTSTSLTYAYNRVSSERGRRVENHEGSLGLGHTLNRVVQLSASGGVRSAVISGNTETESYVSAGASAQAEARRGWRMGATAGRSVSWLPGTHAWTSDYLAANTNMAFSPRLILRGDASLSSSKRPFLPSDTTARREVGTQAGVGLNALPLRTVAVEASVRRSRSGTSLSDGGPSTTYYGTNVRLTPFRTFSASGGWTSIRGQTSRGTTSQASVQWVVAPAIQAAGSYGRSRNDTPGLPPSLRVAQESYSGTLTMALGWDLRASVRYSDTNPGQVSHARQVGAHLSRSFGR